MVYARQIAATCFAIVCFAAAHASLAATPKEVEAALEKGKAKLYKLQKPSGRWEDDAARVGTDHNWHDKQGETFGGYTSIALYALLASGESPQDPRMAAGIGFLRDADVIGIYALGMRCQVWALLPQTPDVKRLLKRDAGLITSTINRGGEASGLWDYDDPSGNPSSRVDHSVSQYGILGLWACGQRGVPVPETLWRMMEDVWRSHQTPDGGWSYSGGAKSSEAPTPSMTAAGVATLFITQEYARRTDSAPCKGNINNDSIEAGLKWMGEHIEKAKDNYTWYGIERIGVASGYKYLGTTDWYAAGAEYLVRSQKPDGSWDSTFPGHDVVSDTALAMLFLSHGRAPVLMNKLQYTVPAGETAANGWNQRPRDVANFARWLAFNTERDFNWQIVNLQSTLANLQEAPILYISGSGSIPMTDEQANKLRAFVEEGGLILGNADCGKPAFNTEFQALAARLFPQYPMRLLEDRHPIYVNQIYNISTFQNKPRLMGASNGVRELMLLVNDADAGRAWHQRSEQTNLDAFKLGADIVLYAVDKLNLLYKGETHVVVDTGTPATRTLKLVRLQAGDNWNPEPGGWRRLANVMKNDYRLKLDITTAKLGARALTDAKIVHLTGTSAIKFDPKAQTELKNFVDLGGTLIIDAAGGSPAFADAMEAQLASIFGAGGKRALITPLPRSHPIYANAVLPITTIGFRPYARKMLVGKLDAPRLKGIPVAGTERIGVFFSREDLSGGLVAQPIDGIVGYDINTATPIMRNLILYVAGGGKFDPVPPAAVDF